MPALKMTPMHAFVMSFLMLLATILGLRLRVHQDNEFKAFNQLLDGVDIPRVPDTANNTRVQNFITSQLQSNSYRVTKDEFSQSTVIGRKRFTNIIGSSNPNLCERLVLACHFDSKLLDGFYGTTDSAVPCAMMLYIAKELGTLSNSRLGLDLIFFDGEEAFKEWTSTDSLYGSTHLAERWENEASEGSNCASFRTRLAQIRTFVLLDLIGARGPVFYSTYPSTTNDFRQLIDAQNKLNGQRQLASANYFSLWRPGQQVDDDHQPFLKRGVPIVHLIPDPFPSVWHTTRDNRSNIHLPTIMDLIKILKEFTVTYVNRG